MNQEGESTQIERLLAQRSVVSAARSAACMNRLVSIFMWQAGGHCLKFISKEQILDLY